MGENQKQWSWKETILLQCLVLMFILKTVSAQLHYSIPEEMQKGSFVGNIAKDLGMDGNNLSNRELRILTRTGMIQYFTLNYNSGHLQTTERIDREEICAWAEKCKLNFQVIVESKRKLYGVEVEVTDINDNAPHFPPGELEVKINEISIIGSRFPLPDATDPDLGINSVQNYQLTGSIHFSLDVQTGENGPKHAELVLEKSLDREEQQVYDLILMAMDGGDPVRTGTAQIQVIVLDVNDNAPIFSQPVYEISIEENIPKGSIVCAVRATDLDEGINGEVKYSFKKPTIKDSQMFLLNSTTGIITLMGNLDFETSSYYEFEVQAMDGGGLSDRSKVVIIVTDLNDNAPELTVTFLTNSIHENSSTGTVIAIINVEDQDSGINSEVTCTIPRNLPFQLKQSIDNFYTLVTDGPLDREQVANYNITITVTDHGMPSLSTATIIALRILDTNDNPPHFARSDYKSFFMENNQRGASIFSLNANDPDWEENSRITYSIIESQVTGSPLSSYLSINSETGVIYALCSFDYEEIREMKFLVKAQDGGSPPLSSNVSVTLFILDQNDNAPQILYPSPPTDGSTGIELAPRSSEPGYLVTKVVAVDADSGQNAWLSYQLIKATEPGLFTLGLHTGEIRTARFFLEKDALKQSLVVLVKDNGQPPMSASVTVTVVLADSIPDMLTDMSSIPVSEDPQSDLTFYLVTAVAFVSCLFLAFLLVLLALRLHRWKNSQLCDNGSVHFDGAPISQFVGIDGVRAFLQSYCHEVSLTSGSRKSQILFPIGSCTNTLTPQQVPDKPGSVLLIGDSNTVTEEAAIHQKSVLIQISDINDNPPAFEKSSYTAYVPENNPSGTSIFHVKASDPDLDRNAQITYSILNSNIKDLPLSSYVSINSETGIIYAQRSFDYEQFREFQIQVKAQDGGSPPLYTSATVTVCVLDRNDNAPQILYPSQSTEGSPFFEMVPRSAESGYLVTKVVAVDSDSGHNAWLSFHLLQATEPSLFSIGSHTGEVQTVRALLERDAVKQRLVILVKDNGHPPLSATTTLSLVFAENFQEALPEMNSQPNDSEYQSDLQFYLVLALTLVSFLFLVTVILTILMKLRRSRNPTFLQCFIPDPHSKAGAIFPPNYEDGTLPYSYQVCLSSESRRNELTFLQPTVQLAENIICNGNSDISLMVSGGNLNSEKENDSTVSYIAFSF
ncbi:protocadherin gamma-A6 isoform X27 [Zootoca vivipara]|uniref:protocadherin gamma-A6 isoform X27 n=1 Tax=Zootoca vivipara TaxID=8524 RepID=UPI00293BD9CC|nr:protocadherin gamma-A6 isoform X27 [Zootoca vivipara]